MLREGDIVEIPLPDGRAAIGWILHISEHFKDAVGFIVFGIKGKVRDDTKIDEATGKPTSMRVLGPLYTDIDAIRHYDWKTIEHQPLSEAKRSLTKRRVGGGVYVADEYLGSAEELGQSDLKPMLFYGMIAVYNEIERAFGKAD